MSEIKKGARIKDNDPRMTSNNRVLEIIDLTDSHVRVRDRMGRFVSISRKRIYTDGKARRSGFDLLKPLQPKNMA